MSIMFCYNFKYTDIQNKSYLTIISVPIKVKVFNMMVPSSKKQRTGCQYVKIFISGIIIGVLITYLVSVAELTFTFNLTSDNNSFKYLDAPIGSVDKDYNKWTNTSIADELFKRVRVLCWILTYPQNHEKKARHIKATWGKRCNILLFMSSEEDATLPAVALPVREGRDNLWAKTKQAFRYVYKHHCNDADWFLKADDDTYVIMENLRYMLMPYKPSEPLYFGCRFKPLVKQGYMTGGAGYVLSGEALRRLVDEAIPNKTLCSQSNAGYEDVEVGKCLERVGVKAVDSRDSFGRGRFFQLNPYQRVMLTTGYKETYWDYMYYEEKQGMEGCSDIAVSFHYVTPRKMYVMEYLIYHLRPIGIVYQIDIDFK